jgi:hypothetical protein
MPQQRQRVSPVPGRRKPCRTGSETINAQLLRICFYKRFLLQSQTDSSRVEHEMVAAATLAPSTLRA